MEAKYTYEKSEVYGKYDVYLTLSGYFTYNNQIIDCECVEEMTEDSINIKTNKSFSLYENVNDKFIINDEYVTLDEGVTLEEFLSSKNLKTIIQKKNWESEIFKLDGGIYYKLDVFETAPNTTDVWVIINNDNEEVWDGVDYTPDVIIRDWCGNETSEKYIRLKDVNPYSPTYGKIIEQLRGDTPFN